MNQRLHIIDALRRAPAIHRPALQERHEREPFDSVTGMVETLTKMHVEAHNKAAGMWDMIQQRDLARLLPLIEELTSPDAAAVSFCKYAATWRKVTRPGDHKDETVSPFGESLLHAAAFAGNLEILSALLCNGADANCKGKHSASTPLHAAAAAGHLAVCQCLLDAGAKINACSLGRRTALYIAASKGFYDVVKLMVARGANPYAGGPSSADTPMAVLRKTGGQLVGALVAELDAICDTGGGLAGGGYTLADGLSAESDSTDEEDEDSQSEESFAVIKEEAGMSDDAEEASDDDSASDDGLVDGATGVPLCPNQHEMKMARIGRHNEIYCDLCGNNVHRFSGSLARWVCHKCDWHFCFKCRPKIAVELTPAQEIAGIYKKEDEEDDEDGAGDSDFEVEEEEEEE